ncbi:MAG TPA: M23 family metallopeptidase [Archangium sp.]|uniref:M23 family metallopeptidase n=1 Tax=Archangium sp. TaxID=1872627 RepID=UPI002E331FF5|nr:M23 family metallopeptidase [Archangium sp.]HEX5753464.1 M23 family metallopeptidase [Archangium sp.]
MTLLKTDRSRGLLAALVLAAAAPGCGTSDAQPDAQPEEKETPQVAQVASAITAPAGTGNYCSVTYPSGGWGFAFYKTGGGDPCDYINDTLGSGFTIQRKGLYSGDGVNNVVVRCDPNYVYIYVGTGDDPLGWAFNAAKGKSNCVFTVAPKNLPIFNSPFSLSTSYTHVTGFDFAKWPYNTLDVTQFGQAGSTTATVVDWKGRDRSPPAYNFIDGHDGHDWLLNAGEPIRAVADGYVMVARDWQSPASCGGDVQKEMFIRHTVNGPSPGPYSYYEQFVSYYAHFSSYIVKAGDYVTQGQIIGYAGTTGCSSGNHLHLSVLRLTNTADKLLETLATYAGPNQHSNGWQMAIEPYGFAPPSGFDPWGWRGYPDGALSINLWKSGQAPGTGSW